MQSKAAKLGSGAGILSVFVGLVVFLHNDISSKVAAQDAKLKTYVDVKLEPVQIKLDNIKENQGEIKDLLKTIDRRVYRMTRSRSDR